MKGRRVEHGAVRTVPLEKCEVGVAVTATLAAAADGLAANAGEVMRGECEEAQVIALLLARNSPVDLVLTVTLRRATAQDLADMERLEGTPPCAP